MDLTLPANQVALASHARPSFQFIAPALRFTSTTYGSARPRATNNAPCAAHGNSMSVKIRYVCERKCCTVLRRSTPPPHADTHSPSHVNTHDSSPGHKTQIHPAPFKATRHLGNSCTIITITTRFNLIRHHEPKCHDDHYLNCTFSICDKNTCLTPPLPFIS